MSDSDSSSSESSSESSCYEDDEEFDVGGKGDKRKPEGSPKGSKQPAKKKPKREGAGSSSAPAEEDDQPQEKKKKKQQKARVAKPKRKGAAAASAVVDLSDDSDGSDEEDDDADNAEDKQVLQDFIAEEGKVQAAQAATVSRYRAIAQMLLALFEAKDKSAIVQELLDVFRFVVTDDRVDYNWRQLLDAQKIRACMSPAKGFDRFELDDGLWPPRLKFPGVEQTDLDDESGIQHAKRVFWLLMMSLGDLAKGGSGAEQAALVREYILGTKNPEVRTRSSKEQKTLKYASAAIRNVWRIGLAAAPTTPFRLLLMCCYPPQTLGLYYDTKRYAPKEHHAGNRLVEQLEALATALGAVPNGRTPLFERLWSRLLRKQDLSPEQLRLANDAEVKFINPTLSRFERFVNPAYIKTLKGGPTNHWDNYLAALDTDIGNAATRLTAFLKESAQQETKALPESEWPVFDLLQTGTITHHPTKDKVSIGPYQTRVAQTVGEYLDLDADWVDIKEASAKDVYNGHVVSQSDLLKRAHEQMDVGNVHIVVRPTDVMRLPDRGAELKLVHESAKFATAPLFPCIDRSNSEFSDEMAQTLESYMEVVRKAVNFTVDESCTAKQVIGASLCEVAHFGAYLGRGDGNPRIELQLHIQEGKRGTVVVAFIRDTQLAVQCQLAQMLLLTPSKIAVQGGSGLDRARRKLASIIVRAANAGDNAVAELAGLLSIADPMTAKEVSQHAWRHSNFLLDHRVAAAISAFTQLARETLRIPHELITSDIIAFVTPSEEEVKAAANQFVLTQADMNVLFRINRMLLGEDARLAIGTRASLFKEYFRNNVTSVGLKLAVLQMVGSMQTFARGISDREASNHINRRLTEAAESAVVLEDADDATLIERTRASFRRLSQALQAQSLVARQEHFLSAFVWWQEISAFRYAASMEFADLFITSKHRLRKLTDPAAFAYGRLFKDLVTTASRAIETGKEPLSVPSVQEVCKFSGMYASRLLRGILGAVARRSQFENTEKSWLNEVAPSTLVEEWATRYTCWLPSDGMVFGDLAARLAASSELGELTPAWPQHEDAVKLLQTTVLGEIPVRTVLPLFHSKSGDGKDEKRPVWDGGFELPVDFSLVVGDARSVIDSLLQKYAPQKFYPVSTELKADNMLLLEIKANDLAESHAVKAAAQTFSADKVDQAHAIRLHKTLLVVKRALTATDKLETRKQKSLQDQQKELLHRFEAATASEPRLRQKIEEAVRQTSGKESKDSVAMLSRVDKTEKALQARLGRARIDGLVAGSGDTPLPNSTRVRAVLHAYCARQLFMALVSLGARRQSNRINTLARMCRAVVVEDGKAGSKQAAADDDVFQRRTVNVNTGPGAKSGTEQTVGKVFYTLKPQDAVKFDDRDDFDTILLKRIIAKLRAVTELDAFHADGADQKFLALVSEHMTPFEGDDNKLFKSCYLRSNEHGGLDTHVDRVFERILRLQTSMKAAWKKGIEKMDESAHTAAAVTNDKAAVTAFNAILLSINNFEFTDAKAATDGQGFCGLVWRLDAPAYKQAVARIGVVQTALFESITLLGQMIEANGPELSRFWNINSAERLRRLASKDKFTTKDQQAIAAEIGRALVSEAVLARVFSPVERNQEVLINDMTTATPDDLAEEQDGAPWYWQKAVNLDGSRFNAPSDVFSSKPDWLQVEAHMRSLSVPFPLRNAADEDLLVLPGEFSFLAVLMKFRDQERRFAHLAAEQAKKKEEDEKKKKGGASDARGDEKQTKKGGEEKEKKADTVLDAKAEDDEKKRQASIVNFIITKLGVRDEPAVKRLQELMHFGTWGASKEAPLAQLLTSAFMLETNLQAKNQVSATRTKNLQARFEARLNVAMRATAYTEADIAAFAQTVLQLLDEIASGGSSAQSKVNRKLLPTLKRAVAKLFGQGEEGEAEFQTFETYANRRRTDLATEKIKLAELTSELETRKESSSVDPEDAADVKAAEAAQTEIEDLEDKIEKLRQAQDENEKENEKKFLVQCVEDFKRYNPSSVVVVRKTGDKTENEPGWVVIDKADAIKDVKESIVSAIKLFGKFRDEDEDATDALERALNIILQALRSFKDLSMKVLLTPPERDSFQAYALNALTEMEFPEDRAGGVYRVLDTFADTAEPYLDKPTLGRIIQNNLTSQEPDGDALMKAVAESGDSTPAVSVLSASSPSNPGLGLAAGSSSRAAKDADDEGDVDMTASGGVKGRSKPRKRQMTLESDEDSSPESDDNG